MLVASVGVLSCDTMAYSRDYCHGISTEYYFFLSGGSSQLGDQARPPAWKGLFTRDLQMLGLRRVILFFRKCFAFFTFKILEKRGCNSLQHSSSRNVTDLFMGYSLLIEHFWHAQPEIYKSKHEACHSAAVYSQNSLLF